MLQYKSSPDSTVQHEKPSPESAGPALKLRRNRAYVIMLRNDSAALSMTGPQPEKNFD